MSAVSESSFCILPTKKRTTIISLIPECSTDLVLIQASVSHQIIGSESFHTQPQTHDYRRQQARNMVIPDWEVTCRETLSLAEMKRTVPRLRVMSEGAAAEVAVASPSITRRMPAQSTGAKVYCLTEAGT